jgi:5'-nucleotidase
LCNKALTGEAVAEPKRGYDEVESDFFAVANGFVSITPIQMDATNYEVLHALQGQISVSLQLSNTRNVFSCLL